ncbi:UTP--glucose-1-phosphate uridylyltransferase [Nitrososphaera sp.]|uniref:UTP--glucose-1-phosphate uridylyltransferase n=1 Tax=Nitrososphaera sp. TaxID=1971748 RepID=UPI0017B7AA55|nr:sugar phosphate nucleotidyltransferase [Nitrososphaera sp.]NWG36475.1 NTP transferase domain-containing protein [Nitrososphaera sp.]
MISKVVIPAAGLGTRLLSATKEQPKEMLPIFAGNDLGDLSVKPIVQVIFEQLHDVGFREFYFIVGRSKRALEDHFTADFEFVKSLERKGKTSQACDLENFYNKLESSTIAWINQPSPLGFGHAVYLAKNLIGNEHFLVHAGDTVIFSEKNRHLTTLLESHVKHKNHCTLLIREVEDPRQFGVVAGDVRKDGLIKLTDIEEKPAKPKTNLAIMPVYIFDPAIFSALAETQAGKGNEIQLTDGIKKLMEQGLQVMASKLSSHDMWIDVGTPETYWEAQSSTYNRFKVTKKS